MYLSFAAALVAAIAVLVLPGAIVLRSLFSSFLKAIVCAPLVSVLMYCVLSIAFSLVGIRCSWETIAAPAFVFSIVFYLVVLLFSRRSKAPFPLMNDSGASSEKALPHKGLIGNNWLFLSIYIIVSLIVAAVFFLGTLDGLNSVYQENDCIEHLSSIRTAFDTGVYFNVKKPIYPQAWYILVSLTMSLTGAEIGVAVNAVNFVLMGIVFPAGMFLFLSKVFHDERRIVCFGSLCVMAFAAFPWGFLLFGPLYPNLAGYCLLPAMMTLFCDAVSGKMPPRERVCRVLLFALSCISLAMLHPNAVFSGAVLLISYCVHALWRSDRLRSNCAIGKVDRRPFAIMAFLAMVVVLWTGLFFAPPLSRVVWFTWEAYQSVPEAVLSALTLDLTKASVPQFALGAFVLVGVVYCVVKRRYLWMVSSYCLAMLVYVASSSTDGFVQHYLSGFWYTDTFRTASTLALSAIPLAALGLSATWSLVMLPFRRIRTQKLAGVLAAFALSLVFLIANYAPCIYIPSQGLVLNGFGQVRDMLAGGNDTEENKLPYDETENEFVAKAMEIIPEGEGVANIPYDGSAYSKGLNGLNVLYPNWYDYVDEKDWDLTLVRTGLCNYTSDERVLEATQRVGVRYVLLLDLGNEDGIGMYEAPYERERWIGLSSINDETPGFRAVLAEGDKRLYELTEL